jgi:hypothetical protein
MLVVTDPHTEDRDGTLRSTAKDTVATAETVFEEYDAGYMDADAALTRLRPALEALATSLDQDDDG